MRAWPQAAPHIHRENTATAVVRLGDQGRSGFQDGWLGESGGS